jgi:aryl-alcohol dehydrogenase-like predicted oxidoreductase
MSRVQACRLVAESIECGVNYFDVSPAYGDGEAEEQLGFALEPHRDRAFLACKTLARTAEGARRELEQSLRRLRTDRFDLYQCHAVNRSGDVDRILAPGGAMEAFLQAREQGIVRFLGFSSHSVPVAMALLDRFPFDSMLFPVNFICYARGDFGPQVLERARERGVACVALKALAYARIGRSEGRTYPNCWYRPIDNPVLALQALRFSLSEGVCAAIPPGDERLYRMAVDLAADVTPLTVEERLQILQGAGRLKPIMWAKKR